MKLSLMRTDLAKAPKKIKQAREGYSKTTGTHPIIILYSRTYLFRQVLYWMGQAMEPPLPILTGMAGRTFTLATISCRIIFYTSITTTELLPTGPMNILSTLLSMLWGR